MPPELQRDEILAAVRAAVEPRKDVLAMWEAGSAAWGREDAYSDVDLQLLVEDDAVAETIGAVDRVLAALGPERSRSTTAHTLQPLLTLLRIRHCPDRFDFGPRYAAIDLPPDVVRRIEPLWFVRGVEDVADQQARAEQIFAEVLDELRASREEPR